MTQVMDPFGGRLVDLLVPEPDRAALLAEAAHLPSIQISERSVCDLELLAVGGFSPLAGFMNSRDYRSVLDTMRLADGIVFPIPITLPIADISNVSPGERIALRDPHNDLLAVLTVEEVYPWDREEFANTVLGTTDTRHPLVTEMEHWGDHNLAGKLEVIALPKRPDFRELRLAPSETRERLAALGNPNVVAFQTRNPIHRAHEEMTKIAGQRVDGTILLHPTVGMTKPGDIDYFTRVRTYKAIYRNSYDPERTVLALTPIAMRMAGPREAVWHAIIRRNYGASHFIVGRDHASPGVNSSGEPFYSQTAAKELAGSMSSEIGVEIITFDEMAYLPDEDRYSEVCDIAPGTMTMSLSGTQIREEYLGKSRRLPEWFSRPEVAEILVDSHPPPEKRGFCVWFTGLSGSGKSATAEVLALRLNELGRRVTVLDGDVVRTHLSKGLGFSREDRDTNILRIGFVASEIVRHGGVAVCAAVSPYRSTRDEVRKLIGDEVFIEVYVDTPLEVCEERDTKGMYAKARRGEIKDFTGIDDPYEPPVDPNVRIETVELTVDENCDLILETVAARQLLPEIGATEK